MFTLISSMLSQKMIPGQIVKMSVSSNMCTKAFLNLSYLLDYKSIVLYEAQNCSFHLEKISHLAVRSSQGPALSIMHCVQYRCIPKSIPFQMSDLEMS